MKGGMGDLERAEVVDVMVLVLLLVVSDNAFTDGAGLTRVEGLTTGGGPMLFFCCTWGAAALTVVCGAEALAGAALPIPQTFLTMDFAAEEKNPKRDGFASLSLDLAAQKPLSELH